jgi:hypothetical protein
MYELAVFAVTNRLSLDKLQVVSLDSIEMTLALYAFWTSTAILVVPAMCLIMGSPWFNELLVNLLPNAAIRFAILPLLYTVFMVPIFIPCMYMLYRTLVKQESTRRALQTKVDHFSVAGLHCSVDADRRYVENQIENCFGSFEPFEQLVTNRLWPNFLKRQYGSSKGSAISYELIMFSLLPHMIFGWDFFLVSANTHGTRAMCTFNMWTLGFPFVWIPMAFRCCALVIGQVRDSAMIPEHQKGLVAVGLATFLLALCCASNVVLANPDVPQGPYTIALACAAVGVWYTW